MPMKDKKEQNSPNNREEEYDWGKHPNSLKALEKNQFRKGVSGNQLGKPFKHKYLTQALDIIGDEVVEEMTYFCKKEGLTKRQIVLEKIWYKAMMGDLKFIILLGSLGCLETKDKE